MSREVVIWSGGMDSTLILHNLAKESTEENPIYAYTISELSNINSLQLEAQELAQNNYLKFAKEKGFYIIHLKIKVEELQVSYPMDQTTAWACLIIPSIKPNDKIHFGYIRGDDFWHYKNAFENFIKYGSILKGISDEQLPSLVFDFEWKKKHEIIASYEGQNIPIDCFWTCDEVKENFKSCGYCNKCKDIDIIETEILVKAAA